MARKKKRLPKALGATLRSGDLDAMKAVFETTELDARDGQYGPTALGMYGIPLELVAWLVAQGADIEAPDRYQRTPRSGGTHASATTRSSPRSWTPAPTEATTLATSLRESPAFPGAGGCLRPLTGASGRYQTI